MEKNMEETTERSDVKRKSRNQGEKRRRDQFNLIVDELNSMVSPTNQKLDKSTVLKATIAFLKQRNEVNVQTQNRIQENWKPLFLLNEEFTLLMLEALDGFIMAFSSHGQILHASENITQQLGYLSADLLNTSIYDLVYEKEHLDVYNILSNPPTVIDPQQDELTADNQVYFSCHLKKRNLDETEETVYELVQFMGYFRHHVEIDESLPSTSTTNSRFTSDYEPKLLFVGMGRIEMPQLVRETFIIDPTKIEFTSRHSLEWKFLFLDQRATPIIGYLPFDVLGTSGYDYYHYDDLEKLIECHEAIMRKGEGTSCFYRFLTKGQRWIWLQTRFYVSYHQWNSKPEFIICTHRTISYADVLEKLNVSHTATSEDKIRYKLPSKSNGIKVGEQKCDERSRNQSSVPMRKPHKISIKSNAKTTTSTQNYIQLNNPSEPFEAQPESNLYVHPQQMQSKPESYEQQNVPLVYQPADTTCLGESSQALRSPCTDQMRPISDHSAQPAVVSSEIQSNIATIQPMPELTHRDIVITPNQSHVQFQLQRQHEKLQQDIIKQQMELQRVAEQLRMTRYAMAPAMTNSNTPIAIRSHALHVNRNAYQSVDCVAQSDAMSKPSAGNSPANSDTERRSIKLNDGTIIQKQITTHENVSRSSTPHQSMQPSLHQFDDGMRAEPSSSIDDRNENAEIETNKFPEEQRH